MTAAILETGTERPNPDEMTPQEYFNSPVAIFETAENYFRQLDGNHLDVRSKLKKMADKLGDELYGKINKFRKKFPPSDKPEAETALVLEEMNLGSLVGWI